MTSCKLHQFAIFSLKSCLCFTKLPLHLCKTLLCTRDSLKPALQFVHIFFQALRLHLQLLFPPLHVIDQALSKCKRLATEVLRRAGKARIG
eukprot:XP_001708594.1 Hypothetical protein GL50803_103107 [Giardia lamblia ATCC 50803]